MKINKFLKLLLINFFLITYVMTISVQAALNTTHFADSFKYYDLKSWRKADGWSNGGYFNCIWRAKNVNFNDGIMELSIDKDNHIIHKYSGGEYRTRNKFGYGIYQIRMKPAKNPGIVSSFFVYTGPSDNAPWDEIDIEFLGKDTTKVQFNYLILLGCYEKIA